MRIRAGLLTIAIAVLTSTSAFAVTAQQEKMKTCNSAATQQSLKGDARKSFMSTCLSAKGTAVAPTAETPQARMKQCNTDAGAKSLRGDDRKAFMKTCLKAH